MSNEPEAEAEREREIVDRFPPLMDAAFQVDREFDDEELPVPLPPPPGQAPPQLYTNTHVVPYAAAPEGEVSP